LKSSGQKQMRITRGLLYRSHRKRKKLYPIEPETALLMGKGTYKKHFNTTNDGTSVVADRYEERGFFAHFNNLLLEKRGANQGVKGTNLSDSIGKKGICERLGVASIGGRKMFSLRYKRKQGGIKGL